MHYRPLYGREHGVAHFHIEGPDFRASVGIASLELIIGSVPVKVLDQALAWASLNQEILLTKWQELNP